MYAFRGLAGRFAPIGVHLAMLLIMVGGTLSATGSFKGSVTVPQGLNFVISDVLGPTGFLSNPTEAFNTEVHVDRFFMDYYDSGEVSDLFSSYWFCHQLQAIKCVIIFADLLELFDESSFSFGTGFAVPH